MRVFNYRPVSPNQSTPEEHLAMRAGAAYSLVKVIFTKFWKIVVLSTKFIYIFKEEI